MAKGAFHQGLGCGMAILFQQLLFQAASVHANADGNVLVFAHIHHSLYPILPADIAGIDSNLAGAAFCSGNGKTVVKMDIRNQGQHAFLADLRKAPGCFHIGHSQTGNLAAGGSQGANLRQRPLYIGGFGIQHGLDYHIRTTADGYIANFYLSGHFFLPLYCKNNVLEHNEGHEYQQKDHADAMDIAFNFRIELLMGDCFNGGGQQHAHQPSAVQCGNGQQIHNGQIDGNEAAEIQ